MSIHHIPDLHAIFSTIFWVSVINIYFTPVDNVIAIATFKSLISFTHVTTLVFLISGLLTGMAA